MRMLQWLLKCTSFVVILGILFASPTTIHAQDFPSPPDDTYLAYYEDPYPSQLMSTLLSLNVCLERFILLNPDIDITHVPYGTPILIPTDEPCYNYDRSEYGYWNFGDGYPPRLKYYENGAWLDEPYYSDDIFYVSPTSLEDLANRFNICVDVLLAENYLLQVYSMETLFRGVSSVDVFIPADAPPCDPDWVEPTGPPNTRPVELASDEPTPLYFVNQYNICIEEFPIRWQYNQHIRTVLYSQPNHSNSTPPDLQNTLITVHIPINAPPCYNEEGQRLIYYDELGYRLDEPYYSDLPVYIAAPGETLDGIASRMGVCLADILRINSFPRMPLNVEMEVFITPRRPCPNNLEPVYVRGAANLQDISRERNICPEELIPLNPHVFPNIEAPNHVYQTGSGYTWMLLPTDSAPCYWEHYPQRDDSIYDIERELNVCYQEFSWSRTSNDQTTLYIRHDVQPCYNERGQRLIYPSSYAYPPRFRPISSVESQPPDLTYSDMAIHIFQPSDTVYSISQQYNVCVHDLLAVNAPLIGARPRGYPTFIPNTRPCYDEASGMPLIYEDEAGNPLREPIVADQLIYYGPEPIGRMSYYYNVCINRIEDANRTKLNREASYLGWIIPTDRPPCYDDSGASIDYVCYDQPVDFEVDYRESDQTLTFDVDGTYCYDISQPETIVWYENRPYQIVSYRSNGLSNPAFAAWCFGVAMDEVISISDNPDIFTVVPYQHGVIPLPTRDCYVQNPDILDEYAIIHEVQRGETLAEIGRIYHVPYQWIAHVNQLDDAALIWVGQRLIIPDWTDVISVVAPFSVVFGALTLTSWLYRRKRRAFVKKKRD